MTKDYYRGPCALFCINSKEQISVTNFIFMLMCIFIVKLTLTCSYHLTVNGLNISNDMSSSLGHHHIIRMYIFFYALGVF